MSITNTAKPGRVFLEPVRKVGRRKNAGSISWLGGHMVVCIGYSEDGLTAAYATVDHIEAIKRTIRREKQSLIYRFLTRAISYYEKRSV